MGESSHALKKPLLGDRSYQNLKKSATVVLPALATLYFAMAQIWHLPMTEEVVGSITAVNTFIGLLLGASTKKYNQLYSSTGVEYAGAIVIDDSGEKKVISLELNDDPESLETKDEVTFRVDGSTTGTTPFLGQSQ